MLIGQLSHYFFGITIFLTSLFLVLLVLVQRGRGGGIAGALGGAGGQSAFGTKAGDLFTRITVGVAAFWILMCCLAISFLKTPTFSTGFSGDDSKMESDDKKPSSGTTDGAKPMGAIGDETNASPTGGITVPAGEGATAPAPTATTPAIDPATAPSVTPPAATPPAGDTAPKPTEPAVPAPTQPTEPAPSTTPPTPEAGAPTTPAGDGSAPTQPSTPNN